MSEDITPKRRKDDPVEERVEYNYTKIVDVNAKVDDLEAAAKKYVSKDTLISIGGYEFTPAKLMVAGAIVSSVLGGLYGAFEVYKDYIGMKKRIAEYVAPDLSDLHAKMNLVIEKSDKAQQYTQDIKNDLKADIRRIEGVVDSVERSNKQGQRETDLSVKEIRGEIKSIVKDVQNEIKSNQNELRANQNEIRAARRDMESSLKQLNNELDKKVQRALDNPLAK